MPGMQGAAGTDLLQTNHSEQERMHGGHTHGSMASGGVPLPAPFEEGSLPPPNTKLPACCCPKLMLSTGPGVSFGRAGVGASLQPLRHPQLTTPATSLERSACISSHTLLKVVCTSCIRLSGVLVYGPTLRVVSTWPVGSPPGPVEGRLLHGELGGAPVSSAGC